ncbi:hypothetical protein D9M72_463520 [compost metagenome]
MVGFAPGGGDGAAREGAALVAGGEGFADVGREDPRGAADVQDAALVAEEDGDDVRVAGDLADGGGGDGAGERERAGARGALFECVEEVTVVDGDHDLGTQTAGSRK